MNSKLAIDMTKLIRTRAQRRVLSATSCMLLLVSFHVGYAADKLKKSSKSKSASSKTSESGGLSDLKLKAGDEKGNDIKALKAELFIASQEEKAIAQIQKLLKKYKGTQLEPDLKLRLAELYMRRSKTDRFLEVHRASEEIVSIAPKLVKSAASQVQIKKAITLYDEIEKRFANFEKLDQVLLNNAFANQQLGNEKQAEIKFSKLIKTFTASEFLPDAHLALGEMKFRQRDFKVALVHFESVRKYPDSAVYPYGIYKAAWTEYNLRNVDKAIKDLEDVIQYGRFVKDQGIDSRLDLRREAMFDLALFYEDSRNSKEAFKYFKEQARELDVSPVILRLSELYKRHSRYMDTRIVLSDMIKYLPLSSHVPEAYSELMDVSERMKKRKDVITLLENFKPVCKSNSKWVEAQQAPIESLKLCAEQFSRLALGYANKWLRAWNTDTSQVELAEVAEQSFSIYLAEDPKTEESGKARFVYAELQFKRGKFRQASENYALAGQISKDKKIGHDARYFALIALEKAVKDKWSDKDESTFRFLAKDYLTKEPNAKYALEIEFKGAFIAYEKARYDEAAPVFLKLGNLYPKEDKGLKSQDLYLDILNLKKDYKSLRDFSFALREKATGDRAVRLNKIYEEAYFLIIQKLEEGGDQPAAIKEYQHFAKANPNSALTQKALWNTTQLYFKMGQLLEGANSSVAYYEKYSSTKEGFDALLKAAQTYESLGQLLQAAEVLITLTRVDAANKEKWSLLAADFYMLSGEMKKAYGLYADLKLSRDQNTKARAYEQLEFLVKRDGDVKKHESLLREIIAFGRQPQASLAAVYFVEKAFNEKQFEDAFNLAKSVISQEKSGASKNALARARLTQARIIADEFKKQSVNAKIERIQLVLTMKTEKLSKAQVAYQSTANYGDPTLSVHALYELAGCYLQYSDALRAMVLPKGLPEEEVLVFKAEMDKLAIPMEEKGIETMVQAYQLAKGLGLDESLVSSIKADMKKLNQPVSEVTTVIKLQSAPINLPKVEGVGA